MLLLIDNFYSFTFNLAQYLGELGAEVVVRRNNEITLDEIDAMRPAHIVISPGPGRPEQAGVSIDVIERFGSAIPMLGVCLGHQAMGAAFGGHVVRAGQLMHGKTSMVDHDGRGVFKDLQGPFAAARYHSLIVSDDDWPSDLIVAARTADTGTVMGLRHRVWPMHGVQFHPEGRHILRNFLDVPAIVAAR